MAGGQGPAAAPRIDLAGTLKILSPFHFSPNSVVAESAISPMSPAAKNPPRNAAPGAASGDMPADFESAMTELEEIVERMEGGELTLEESLAAHKRGLELSKYCQTVLAQAQQQVRILEDNTLKTLDEIGQQD